MDVFGYGTDEVSRPLLSPAICFICENSPTQEAQKVIDTTREFNPECLTRLSGRKYVCGACAEELGKAVGMVSQAQFATVEQMLIETSASVVALNDQVEEALATQTRVVSTDEIADAVSEVIRAELAKQVVKKPTAAKPKVAPDA